MKRLQRLALSILITTCAATLGAIPVRAADVIIHFGAGVAVPGAPVYHYVYYPDAGVYFDPVGHVYWWLSDGAWVSGPAVPGGIVLGGGVNLAVDQRDPWHHHDEIVRRFPGHGHERGEERHEDHHEDHHDEH